MSYELISKRAAPCPCGKGTFTHILELDDWNRARETVDRHCKVCKRDFERRAKEEVKIKASKQTLKRKAVSLAKGKFLKKWLSDFDGLTKKKIWEKMTKGPQGHPSLSTFYGHIKYHGNTEKYLRWRFESHIEELFPSYFQDSEIEDLLKRSRS